MCRWSGTDHLRKEATWVSGLIICDCVLRMLCVYALAALQTSQLTVDFLSDVAKMKYFKY